MRRLSGVELRFCTPFIQNPRVVEPFIRIAEPVEDLFDLPDAIGRTAGELIGECEAKNAQGELMLWIDGKDIVTDRLCFFRFVEGTIEFSLGDGLGDSCGR